MPARVRTVMPGAWLRSRSRTFGEAKFFAEVGQVEDGSDLARYRPELELDSEFECTPSYAQQHLEAGAVHERAVAEVQHHGLYRWCEGLEHRAIKLRRGGQVDIAAYLEDDPGCEARHFALEGNTERWDAGEMVSPHRCVGSRHRGAFFQAASPRCSTDEAHPARDDRSTQPLDTVIDGQTAGPGSCGAWRGAGRDRPTAEGRYLAPDRS